MDELKGLYLINKEGECLGIIEDVFYNPGRNKYIVNFKGLDGEYITRGAQKENFESYMQVAKLKSDRFKIIRDRNIYHIYHFSPSINIDDILKYGLVSRDYAKRLGIDIEITDQLRLDRELNKISASISYPNYKMRYSLECKGYNLYIYDINPRLLLTRLDTQFYQTNAASGRFYFVDKKSLTTNEAFEEMFTPYNRDPNIPDSYTTDPQAEILVHESIPKDYIQKVITNGYVDSADLLCFNNNIKYDYESELHAPRKDYARW